MRWGRRKTPKQDLNSSLHSHWDLVVQRLMEEPPGTNVQNRSRRVTVTQMVVLQTQVQFADGVSSVRCLFIQWTLQAFRTLVLKMITLIRYHSPPPPYSESPTWLQTVSVMCSYPNPTVERGNNQPEVWNRPLQQPPCPQCSAFTVASLTITKSHRHNTLNPTLSITHMLKPQRVFISQDKMKWPFFFCCGESYWGLLLLIKGQK